LENVHITATVVLWEAEVAQFSALDLRVKEPFTDVAHRELYPPLLQISIKSYNRQL